MVLHRLAMSDGIVGGSPPVDGDRSLAAAINALNWVVFPLSWVSVALRTVSRVWISHNFGWDDAMMIFCQVGKDQHHGYDGTTTKADRMCLGCLDDQFSWNGPCHAGNLLGSWPSPLLPEEKQLHGFPQIRLPGLGSSVHHPDDMQTRHMHVPTPNLQIQAMAHLHLRSHDPLGSHPRPSRLLFYISVQTRQQGVGSGCSSRNLLAEGNHTKHYHNPRGCACSFVHKLSTSHTLTSSNSFLHHHRCNLRRLPYHPPPQHEITSTSKSGLATPDGSWHTHRPDLHRTYSFLLRGEGGRQNMARHTQRLVQDPRDQSGNYCSKRPYATSFMEYR